MSNEREAMNDRIREIFLANGFTIKEGQTDLKPYVYEAAYALLRATQFHAGATGQEPVGTLSIHRFRKIDSMVNHDFEYYGSLPDGTYRVYAAPIGDNGAFVVPERRRGETFAEWAKRAYEQNASQPAESKRVELTDEEIGHLRLIVSFCETLSSIERGSYADDALRALRLFLARASAKGA